MTASDDDAPAQGALPIRLPKGTVVGRYVVDGWMRDGGMAALYRGHHVKTGARVAIKVQIRAQGAEDEETTAARFDREGEVMGRLSGVPNVVQVHDVDALDDGRRYLVMEWVEGDNLEEVLDGVRNSDTALSIPRACRLLRDVALALDAAHRADVVHRDIKPSNIMIDSSLADREVAKLLDFGISADLGTGGRGGELTATGIVLGTSGYVAPEQAIGLAADPGFDIYSLGVVIFEAVTGFAVPPDGLGPDRLPPMRQLRPSVPQSLEELVAACLSRDPTKRPSSAAAIAERLAEIAATLEPSVSTAAGAVVGVEPRAEPAAAEVLPTASEVQPSAASPARRSPAPWIAVGLVVLAVAAAGWWWQRGSTSTSGDSGAIAPPGAGSEANALTAESDQTAPAVAASTGSEPDATQQGQGPVTSDASTSATEAETKTLATTAGGDTEAEPASSTDDDGAASPPNATRSNCKQARSSTEAAVSRRDWRAVLRASSDAACWPNPADKVDRKAARVRALLELKRYDRCVTEGAGVIDPRVARVTKYCREHAAKDGG